MADHNAHTYFGQEVMKRLPRDLRSHCTADLPAFHLGLYGPDPLIFSFQTKKTSDKLHKQWQNVSLPALSKALRHGDATQRSFAAGYLLHLLLDDTVHPPIYRWMEEGASHFRMEVALDLILLEEQRRANSPKVHTEGKERTARTAAGFIHPVKERQYLSGLWRMATLSNRFCGPGQVVSGVLRQRDKTLAHELRDRMEAQILPAERELEGLLMPAEEPKVELRKVI